MGTAAENTVENCCNTANLQRERFMCKKTTKKTSVILNSLIFRITGPDPVLDLRGMAICSESLVL
jgi:hypothetical protein